MIEYIILGIIQGIFEWIPISSEGVVALAANGFNLNALDTALFLHLGTLFAIVVYFYKDWIKVLTFKDKKLLKFLFIATIFSVIIGGLLYNMINLFIGPALLLLTGIGLLFTAFFHRSKKKFNISENWLAIIVGAIQGLAVIPGLSRSASTIFGLSLKKEDPQEILRYSYMMSVPMIFVGSIYLIIKNPSFSLSMFPGLIAAFIVGLITLKIIFKLSSKIDFFKFAIGFSILCFVGFFISLI